MIQIAHRGHSHKYGDNNMLSFQKAFEDGFEMIELDIQLCGSGEIIIYHDTYIDSQYINKLSYDYLKQKDIILLEDFFREFRNKDVFIYLDIKGSYKVSYPLIDMLKKWFSQDSLKKIYISGFDRKFVDVFVDSQLPIHLGFTTENNFPVEQLKHITKHCSFACLHWTALDVEAIKFFKKNNIAVYSYTCKEDFILQYMKQFDLDGIVTNYPI